MGRNCKSWKELLHYLESSNIGWLFPKEITFVEKQEKLYKFEAEECRHCENVYIGQYFVAKKFEVIKQ